MGHVVVDGDVVGVASNAPKAARHRSELAVGAVEVPDHEGVAAARDEAEVGVVEEAEASRQTGGGVLHTALGLDVPDDQRVIVLAAEGGEVLAVVREGQLRHLHLVQGHAVDDGARLEVPHDYVALKPMLVICPLASMRPSRLMARQEISSVWPCREALGVRLPELLHHDGRSEGVTHGPAVGVQHEAAPTLPSNPMTDSRVSEAVAMASNGPFAGAVGGLESRGDVRRVGARADVGAFQSSPACRPFGNQFSLPGIPRQTRVPHGRPVSKKSARPKRGLVRVRSASQNRRARRRGNRSGEGCGKAFVGGGRSAVGATPWRGKRTSAARPDESRRPLRTEPRRDGLDRDREALGRPPTEPDDDISCECSFEPLVEDDGEVGRGRRALDRAGARRRRQRQRMALAGEELHGLG